MAYVVGLLGVYVASGTIVSLMVMHKKELFPGLEWRGWVAGAICIALWPVVVANYVYE